MFKQSAVVETYLGSGGLGDLWASPVTVQCAVFGGPKLVRDAEGREVISNVTVYAPLVLAPMFEVGTKVTTDGRTARVVTTDLMDVGPAYAHHVQVGLV